MTPKAAEELKRKSNRAIAVCCLAFFGAMIGASYAAVPFYAMFCKLTGFNGTPIRVEQASDVILDRPITVRFDGNVSGGLPWSFEPEQRSVTMKIGETVQVKFKATNLFDKPTSGRASFNVTPELAGAYFNKLECFCFTDNSLKPGETLELPVVFYVDPDIVKAQELKDIRTITLSYTFFPTAGPKVSAVGDEAARKPETGG